MADTSGSKNVALSFYIKTLTGMLSSPRFRAPLASLRVAFYV
jgi:hypothetical protein